MRAMDRSDKMPDFINHLAWVQQRAAEALLTTQHSPARIQEDLPSLCPRLIYGQKNEATIS
jgi:hypothetical protein